MRPIFLILILPVMILAASLTASAQTCTGSLGDPIAVQDFGSGVPIIGPQLPNGATTYTFLNGTCPNDGSYTIARSTSGCFSNTWITVPSDHTGDPNGYMMIVNASQDPGVFYTQEFDDLCPNTTYEISAYILNLLVPSACGGAPIQPNLTFTIESQGVPIKTYNTGNIPATGIVNWVQYGTYAQLPPGQTSLTVKITNNAPGGCGNDLILDDITFRACGPMITPSVNNAPTSAPQICQGANTSLTLSGAVQPGVYTQPAYQWQTSHDNGITWADTAGQTSNTLTAKFVNAVVGTYLYRLAVADGSNISSPKCRVFSTPFTVSVTPNPVISGVSPTDSQCEGDEMQLSATGGTDYVWTGPNLAPTHQNPLYLHNLTAANAGTYTVTAFSAYGCTSSATTQLTVFPKPKAVVTGNASVCTGSNTPLSASGGVKYSWSPGNTLSDSTIANPIASPTDTTTYRVIVTNSYNCADTAFVTINTLKTPIANAGPNKVIFEGQSVKLTATATNANVFSWTPTTGLSDPTILNPIASPTDDITYTLHATSNQNCGTSSSNVFVRVYKKIVIPTSFSPNNDGINDYWNIDALITYPQSIMTVFNRYGQQVYRDIGYSKPWNGTYNGQPLPVGTYYYILDLKNNTPKMSGWVVIVR